MFIVGIKSYCKVTFGSKRNGNEKKETDQMPAKLQWFYCGMEDNKALKIKKQGKVRNEIR